MQLLRFLFGCENNFDTCKPEEICIIEKRGYATVYFFPGTFLTDTDVEVFISSLQVVDEIFNETASIFGPNGRLSYEVQITVTEPLQSEYVYVIMNVPDAFLLDVPINFGIEVFTLRENGSEEVDSFLLFDIEEDIVEFNATAKTITFGLPGAAFLEGTGCGGGDDGGGSCYVALMTLSSTLGLSREPLSRRLAASDECQALPIRCPVAKCTVTSGFVRNRMQNSPVKDHFGVNLRAGLGTEVFAAAVGEVTALGEGGPYGLSITIRHDDGSKTLYAHLSYRLVTVKQRVNTKTRIGLSGDTGYATGRPHLHLEYVPNRNIPDVLTKVRVDPEACFYFGTVG